MKHEDFLFLLLTLFIIFAINISEVQQKEIKFTKIHNDFLMPQALKDTLEKNDKNEKHQKENQKHKSKNGIYNQIKYKRRIGFIPQTEYES